MSVRALFPMTKATIRLTAMGSMSGALTNYLLGMLVMKASNPVPVMAKEHFKLISEKTIDGVMEIVGDKGCQLTKAELAALQELANSYKETFTLVG
jgi:hypothetical protein